MPETEPLDPATLTSDPESPAPETRAPDTLAPDTLAPAPPPGWSPPPLPGTTGWVAPSVSLAQAGQVPAGPNPSGPRRQWWVPVVAVLLIALAASGIAWWRAGHPAAGSTPGTTGPASPGATGTPSGSAAPPASTAPAVVFTSGGQLGVPVPLQAGTGSATVTVSRAAWGGTGEMAPAADQTYLVIDLTATGRSGEVTVGTITTLAVTADGRSHGDSFGPTVDEPLASTVLEPGGTATGQVGFMLPEGPVTITFTDPDGHPIGTVEVPAP